MTNREAIQQALEALQAYGAHTPNCDYLMLLTSLPPQRKPCSCGLVAAIAALRERLAQPEQEPVKFNCTVVDDAHPEGVPLSQWGRQSLTEATIRNMCEHVPDYDISTHDLIQFARAIERAHGIKEKNT